MLNNFSGWALVGSRAMNFCRVAKLTTQIQGTFCDVQRLCDHPSYCKTDTSRSIYIGQNHHIAYPPHRNNDSYFPSGILFIFGIVNLIFSFVIGTVNHNLLGGIVLKSKGWKDVRTQKLTGAFCTYTRVRRPANHTYRAL